MGMSAINILENLEEDDKNKVSYFIELLLNKSKYQNLKDEISLRRKEIEQDKTFAHDDIWKTLNV